MQTFEIIGLLYKHLIVYESSETNE